MHRLFGKKKPDVPAPTLDDASNSMTRRGNDIDAKIAKLDAELLKYKQQLSRMKPGPAKNQVQARALNILKQKKMYGGQRDTLYNQQFNIDQTKFAQEGIKDTQTTVAAMKQARTELKKGMKQMNLDEIEDLHDDMEDLLEDTNEVQEILGRSYGVPEELDETDLMAELDGLEELDEQTLAEDTTETAAVPSYLQDAAKTSTSQQAAMLPASSVPNMSSMPAAPNRAISSQQPATSSAPSQPRRQTVEVDEFGLPSAGSRKLM